MPSAPAIRLNWNYMSQQSLSHNESKTTWVTFLAVGIVIVALVLYYILIDQSIWVRLAILFGGIALAVGIVAISPEGKRFIVYARESWYEVKSSLAYPQRSNPNDLSCFWLCPNHVTIFMVCRQINWMVSFSVLLGWKWVKNDWCWISHQPPSHWQYALVRDSRLLRYGKSVKKGLEERIAQSGMADKFGRILVPSEEVVEIKGGKSLYQNDAFSLATYSLRWKWPMKAGI